MNLVPSSADGQSNMLFVNFNQDCTSLAVGTKTGYHLYSLSSTDKLENIFKQEGADICVIDRLFASSLVAVVSLSSPRKLKVCHFKKGTEICSYSYSNTILAAKLNRLRLVVCLEESLYIHNIRDMKVLHTIRDTPPNPHGICAVSVNNDNCYLAYPGSSQIGEVQIFDIVNLRAVSMVTAHDNPLAAISFNSLGNRLATASEKGTVIRVFSVPDGQKLFEFRRGVKRCATIHSLAFSPDSMFICCTSNTETVHVFKLENVKDRQSDDCSSTAGSTAASGGWIGYFGAALKTSANYLPTQVTDMLNQGRDFAIARLPFSGHKSICAITSAQKSLRLLVAAQDGYLYVYSLDTIDGGECTLLKQHRIDGLPESSSPSAIGDSAGLLATAGTAPVGPASPTNYATGPKTESSPWTNKSEGFHSEARRSSDEDSLGTPTSRQTSRAADNLRLDDDNEFPPVSHKIE